MVDIIRPFLFSKRETLSLAAREADFDEHRADVRGFGCDGGDGRDYAYCA